MLNTSCEPYEHGYILYHIEFENYSDNYAILGTAIGNGLAEAGVTPERAPYYWTLDGEKKAMNKKAGDAFTKTCAAIDKDRSLLAYPSTPIKGVTAKLHFVFGTADEGYCATYTFKEEDN